MTRLLRPKTPVRPVITDGSAPARPSLRIGLVNNMPDAALQATERQFAGLLQAAAGGFDIELFYFTLSGVERGPQARAHMAERYADADTLPNAALDGLIVTGAEPRARDLCDEAFWNDLTRVVDWTESSATPAIWSCLAAHAAVRHLDGVRRHRLPVKLSGVFASQPVSSDPLTVALPDRVWTPHSRENQLVEDELVAAGYQMLTRSPEAGVDSFVRRGQSLGLFFQGHPEYDADTLMREYSRDVARFLKGERPTHPATPRGYFGDEAETALAALATQANGRLAAYGQVIARATPLQTWRPSALQMYASWLGALGGPGVVRGELTPAAANAAMTASQTVAASIVI